MTLLDSVVVEVVDTVVAEEEDVDVVRVVV